MSDLVERDPVEEYTTQLRRELRHVDLSRRESAEIVAAVKHHCATTGEDPETAYDSPHTHAHRMALEMGSMRRSLAVNTAGISGGLLALPTAGPLVTGEAATVGNGTLLYMAAAAVALILTNGPLKEQFRRIKPPHLNAIVVGTAIAAIAVNQTGGIGLPAWIPAIVAAGLATWTAQRTWAWPIVIALLSTLSVLTFLFI